MFAKSESDTRDSARVARAMSRGLQTVYLPQIIARLIVAPVITAVYAIRTRSTVLVKERRCQPQRSDDAASLTRFLPFPRPPPARRLIQARLWSARRACTYARLPKITSRCRFAADRETHDRSISFSSPRRSAKRTIALATDLARSAAMLFRKIAADFRQPRLKRERNDR